MIPLKTSVPEVCSAGVPSGSEVVHPVPNCQSGKKINYCPYLRLLNRANFPDVSLFESLQRLEKIRHLKKASSERKLVYSSKTDRKRLSDTFESFLVYPYSVKIKRKRPPVLVGQEKDRQPPPRSTTNISGFSNKSKARLKLTADNSQDYIKSQFCMTYHNVLPINGRELKNDLSKFRKRVARKFSDVRFIWIAEFQTNGNPHFHFYSSIDVTPENHEFLAHAWHDIAGYGSESHFNVQRHGQNFIKWQMYSSGYLTKYLDKSKQKDIPPGFSSFGRFWGSSANLVPKVVEEIDKTEIEIFSDQSPAYILRNLCRYDESKNRRSTIRKTPQSRIIYSAAPILQKLFHHKNKECNLDNSNSKEVVVSKTIYHTIMFDYQGQTFFSDCILNRRLPVDDLIRAFTKMVFDDSLLDEPITNLEISIDHDPVFRLDVYEHHDYLNRTTH